MLVLTVTHHEKEDSYSLEVWKNKETPFFLRKNDGEGFGMTVENLHKMLADYFENNM